MSCNCKEEKYKNIKRYSDDGENVLESFGVFRKVFSFLSRVVFGILVFVLVIITLPIIVVVIILSAIFGHGVKIDLRRLFRLNGRKQKKL